MKNRKLFNWQSALMALAALVIISSCKKKFDEPPIFEEPNITANKTIAAFKAMHVTGSVEKIEDDIIIEGVVNADDRSGNYYKQISIQDSTAGLTIRLDGNNLYTTYPVGRKIYIKLKGLFLGDYNGLVQIGGSQSVSSSGFPQVDALASNLFDTYIVPGSPGNTVTPKVIASVADLNASYQSMLIQLDNAEFTPADTSKTYADVANSLSVNLNVRTCTNSSTIIVRTSGYASFAGINAPNGNGTLLSIYTTFGSTKQLIVRDTSDVKFYNNRCGATGGGGTGTRISIAALRAMYTADMKLGSYQIGGVVISDATNKNISAGNVVLQDGNAGVQIYFGGTLTYNVGDSVIVDITGDSLINYRGSLEVKTAFGATPPAAVATGKTVTPVTRTIAQVNSGLGLALGNAGNIEFTLTKVVGATASPAGTFSGNKTITDASGNMTLYTASGATFASTTLPTGSVDWTGIPSTFNSTKQLQIRNTSDYSGGGTTPPPTGTLLDENFETVGTTGSTPIALTGWVNYAETGGVQYLGKTFSSNKYAQITAFSSNQATVKSWLITPSINLNNTTTETLTFNTKDGFSSGTTTLKVYYSTNYTGSGSPTGATWTQLTATIASGTTSGYATNFTPSGDVNLSAITGANVYIAFVYEGGTPTNTTTFQIDDVKVIGN